MSEWSTGTHTERMSRREKQRIKGVQLICRFLSERHTQEPFPAMSDHFRVPGAVGSVVVPELVPEQFSPFHSTVSQPRLTQQLAFDFEKPPA